MLHCCRDFFLGQKATEVHRGHQKIIVLNMMMMTMMMMVDDDDNNNNNK